MRRLPEEILVTVNQQLKQSLNRETILTHVVKSLEVQIELLTRQRDEAIKQRDDCMSKYRS